MYALYHSLWWSFTIFFLLFLLLAETFKLLLAVWLTEQQSQLRRDIHGLEAWVLLTGINKTGHYLVGGQHIFWTLIVQQISVATRPGSGPVLVTLVHYDLHVSQWWWSEVDYRLLNNVVANYEGFFFFHIKKWQYRMLLNPNKLDVLHLFSAVMILSTDLRGKK